MNLHMSLYMNDFQIREKVKKYIAQILFLLWWDKTPKQLNKPVNIAIRRVVDN